MSDRFIKISNTFLETYNNSSLSGYSFLLYTIKIHQGVTESYITTLPMLTHLLGYSQRTESYQKITKMLEYLSKEGYIKISKFARARKDEVLVLSTDSPVFEADANFTILTMEEYTTLLYNSSNSPVPLEKVVSVFLYIKSYGQLSFPSVRTITASIGYSDRTINQILKYLQDLHVLYSGNYNIKHSTNLTIKKLMCSTQPITSELLKDYTDTFRKYGYQFIKDPNTNEILWED